VDARLGQGAYRPTEAARLAGTSATTIGRWLRGDPAPGRKMAPVLARDARGLLSYLDLVELAFVADFRRLGLPLKRLRQGHDYLKTTFGVHHPFAQVRFQTDGLHLLAPFGDQLLAVDAGGQLSWPTMIQDRLGQLDYDDGGVAVRWFPRGRHGGVVVDPFVGFGSPLIEGTGMPTWAVRDRHRAGEPPTAIAEDLGLTAGQITAALRLEGLA